MKKYIRYSLIAAVILGLSSTQVRAGDDEAWAAIGGFVAGVITGTIIDDDHHYRGNVHIGHDPYYRPKGHHPRKHKERGYRPHRGKHGNGPQGRWEMRRVKIWVPGHWEFTYGRHGNRIRIWQSGHHVWRKNRVWIPYHGKGSHRRNWD